MWTHRQAWRDDEEEGRQSPGLGAPSAAAAAVPLSSVRSPSSSPSPSPSPSSAAAAPDGSPLPWQPSQRQVASPPRDQGEYAGEAGEEVDEEADARDGEPESFVSTRDLPHPLHPSALVASIGRMRAQHNRNIGDDEGVTNGRGGDDEDDQQAGSPQLQESSVIAAVSRGHASIRSGGGSAVAMMAGESTDSSPPPLRMPLELIRLQREQQRASVSDLSPGLASEREEGQQQQEPPPQQQHQHQPQQPSPQQPADEWAAAEPSRRLWMAVFQPQKSARIGVAYFALDDETLYGAEYASMEAVQTLKQKLQPDTIVTTTQPADELYQDLMYNELEPGRPFSVRLMKRHDFTVESAIQRLRLLQVESLDDHAGGDGGGGDDEEGGGGGAGRTVKELSKLEHTLLLRSALDFSKTNMVCAMGGLILHLLHSSIFSQLEADPLLEPILIRAINTIPDSDVLEVDAATMASLGVFVSEAHPGGGTRSKEGLSLFGQLNRTRTQPGAQLLRHWLTYPSTNVECLLQRQQHIAYFVQPNNAELTGHLRQHLRHVKDITRLLLRFQDKPAKPVHYRSLVASLDNMLGIHGLIQDRVDDLPLFSSLHSLFVREIASLSETITGVLKIGNDEDGGGDWGVGGGGGRARKRRGATVDGMEAPLDVRDGVSRKLDHMRDLYVRIDALLSEESAEDHRQLHRQGRLPAELIDQLVLVYMPQIGFLAKLPADPQTSPRAMERSQSLRGFEFKFRTYTDIFYKSDTTNRLDEQYGDIQGYITDARHNIIRQVQAKIMSFAEVLANIGSKMAELDCYLSLAVAAIDLNLVCPDLTTDAGVLHIREGRHLLKEKRIEQFVANDTKMGSSNGTHGEEGHGRRGQARGYGKIHMITGPNNSGKTVYLKQVGLIVYMAHTGSFVPAASATIGICDRILTRTKSIESVLSNFSTFTYDSSQVSYLLRRCTSRSLCLIDEYGKGTANLDGIALLAGVVHHLAQLGPQGCPKTLIPTHFHELFSLGIIEESNMKMDFLSSDDQSHGDGVVSSAVPTPLSSSAPSPAGYRNWTSAPRNEGENGWLGSSEEEPNASRSKTHLPKITCLYKLKPGVSKRSFGLSCAVAAGVPESLMVRASQIAGRIASGRAVEPLDLASASSASSSASIAENGGTSRRATAGHSHSHASSTSLPSFTAQERGLWEDFVRYVLQQAPAMEVQEEHGEGSLFAEMGDDEEELASAALQRRLARIDAGSMEQLYLAFMTDNNARVQELKLQEPHAGTSRRNGF